jgi:isocitrate/isopropylmalate dehydrogenase
MLSSLGEKKASETIDKAVSDYLEKSPGEKLPVEMGGKGSTEDVCNDIMGLMA